MSKKGSKEGDYFRISGLEGEVSVSTETPVSSPHSVSTSPPFRIQIDSIQNKSNSLQTLSKGVKVVFTTPIPFPKWPKRIVTAPMNAMVRFLKTPLHIPIPHIRMPHVRLPRLKVPRLRIPKIRRSRRQTFQGQPSRKPRVRLRLPRVRAPRLRMPRVHFNLNSIFGFTQNLAKTAAFSLLIFTMGFFTINAEAYSELTMAWLTQQFEEPIEIVVETEEEVVEQELLPISNNPEEQKLQITELDLDVTPPSSDNRLIISALDKNIPIIDTEPSKLLSAEWTDLDEALLEDLREGVIRYPGTARPGEVGNVFITGHSSYYFWDPGRYKDVFARLSHLKVGDDIQLYYDQSDYHYEVYEIEKVSRNDVSVLEQPSDDRILTLMTCTPVGMNTSRLIVRARLVESS